MNNPTLNAALSELEQNLKKLDSARNQVEKVSGKTSEIISSVSNLTHSIENLRNRYTEEEKKLKQIYVETSTELTNDFKSKIEKIKKLADDYQGFQNEHTKSIQLSVDKLNSSLSEASQKIGEIDIEKNYGLIQESLENQYLLIDKNFSSFGEDLKEIANQIKNQIASIQSIEPKLLELQELQKANSKNISKELKNNHTETENKLTEIKLFHESMIKSLDEYSSKAIGLINEVNSNFSLNLGEIKEKINDLNSLIVSSDSSSKSLLEKIQNNQRRNLIVMSVGIILIVAILIFK
jgi:chromosome segregation ATPase